MKFHPFFFLTKLISSLIQKIRSEAPFFEKNFTNIENLAQAIIRFIPKDEVSKLENEIQTILKKHNQLNVRYVTYYCEDYPSLLREIHDPPIILFYSGNIKILKSNCVSIVGTRKSSPISLLACEAITEQISKNQEFDSVVSGVALGVDRKIMEEFLNRNLGVIGVMATGFEKFYPDQNRDLYKRIKEDKNSVLISENLTSENLQKYSFPKRNRIITGLSENLIIIEAPIKSGVMSSANSALEQNRNICVFDHPLQIDNKGGQKLLKDGASPINLDLTIFNGKIKHYTNFINDYDSFSEKFFHFSEDRLKGKINCLSHGYFKSNKY